MAAATRLPIRPWIPPLGSRLALPALATAAGWGAAQPSPGGCAVRCFTAAVDTLLSGSLLFDINIGIK